MCPEVVVYTIECTNCKGRGHRVKNEIKELCPKCDGTGELCHCHKVALFRCPKKQEAEDY